MKLNSTQKLVLIEIIKNMDDECRYDYDFSTYNVKLNYMLKEFEKFINENL